MKGIYVENIKQPDKVEIMHFQAHVTAMKNLASCLLTLGNWYFLCFKRTV